RRAACTSDTTACLRARRCLARGGDNMFCPNCGNQAAGDQKFCRSCGMNLQKVSPAVAEHLAESDSDQIQIQSANDLRRPALRRVLLGMTLMFVGVAVSVIGKMFIHDEQTRGVGALISIAGMFLTGYFSLSAMYQLTLAGRRKGRSHMRLKPLRSFP